MITGENPPSPVAVVSTNNADDDDFVNPLEGNDHAGEGVIRLSGHDSTRQKIFINGKQTKADIVGEVIVDFANEIVLRIEERGKKHFI